jgi:hypothetical protein
MTPRAFTLGQVVAETHFVHEAADGTTTPVTIKLGCPVLDAGRNARSWLCPYQISGLGPESVRAIFGTDSMQALILAVHTVPAELAVFIRGNDGRLLRHGHVADAGLSACLTTIECAGDVFPAEPPG